MFDPGGSFFIRFFIFDSLHIHHFPTDRAILVIASSHSSSFISNALKYTRSSFHPSPRTAVIYTIRYTPFYPGWRFAGFCLNLKTSSFNITEELLLYFTYLFGAMGPGTLLPVSPPKRLTVLPRVGDFPEVYMPIYDPASGVNR